MPYLLAIAAALLVIPAVGLGLVAVSLALAAGIIVFVCAVALGATGSVLHWILALTAVGVSWPAVQGWRRVVDQVRGVLVTVGLGTGRPRGD